MTEEIITENTIEVTDNSDYIGPDFKNVNTNRKRSRRRDFNEYGKVTQLVKKFKETNKDEDMLDVLKALEGIINTYTIIMSPGNANQQIHFNPYMKKFLGMFLTPAEQVNSTYQTYMQAVYRVRWIVRHYSYEDIYSQVVLILIDIIKKMKVIGDCDCIYYIQLVAKFKLHDFILKIAKDSIVNIKDIPISFSDNEDETQDDIIDRLSFNSEFLNYEDRIIEGLYDSVDVDCLDREDDLFKILTNYEKYIIYLLDYMCLSRKQILSVLKFENEFTLEERIEDIKEKLKVLASEK